MSVPVTWLTKIRRYLAVLTIGNLIWEFAQMPLYSLWNTGSTQEIIFAAIHCTGGDVLIGMAALIGSILLFGTSIWPNARFVIVAISTLAAGLVYTIYSEHLNTARGAWSYSPLMPVLAGLGTGLAPLTQWLVVPLLAFAFIRLPQMDRRSAKHSLSGLDLPTMAITTSSSTPDHLARSNRRAS